jgi:hypothetical protein
VISSNDAETLDDKSTVVTLIDSSGASQLCSVTGGKDIESVGCGSAASVTEPAKNAEICFSGRDNSGGIG